jgi:uncharacterized protein YfbU (UPF0304 family)
VQAKTERFELRLDEDVLARVDEWRGEQDDSPSRAEAIRQLVGTGLRVKWRDAVEFSDGEKLIILMLCDMMKQLKIRGDTNPDFLQSVIFGGHYWGLKWDLTGVFHGHVDRPEVVRETSNFLDMWSFIEFGYAKLSKKEKDRIEKEAPPFGKFVRFPGFDGNYESEHVSVAEFLIRDMGRFSNFKGRDLNSHAPLLPAYRRMYPIFEPMRTGLGGSVELGADQIIKLMQAMAHGDRR